MFKPGDVVRCIIPRDVLQLNKLYVVKHQFGELVKLEEESTAYYARRFELSDQKLDVKVMKKENVFQFGDLVLLTNLEEERQKYLENMMFPVNRIYNTTIGLEISDHKGVNIPTRCCVHQSKLSRTALYREAARLDIENRSKMSKEELIDAIKAYKFSREFPPNKRIPLGVRLIKKAKVTTGVTCSSYAFSYEDGTEDIHHYTACHAGFNYIKKKLKCVVENVADKYQSMSEKYKPLYTQFVDYIINRSPWKSAFIPANVNKAISEGVYVNLDEHFSNVVKALICLRQGHENTEILNSWKWFLDKGFDENTAWAAGQFIYIQPDGKLVRRSPNGAHDWLSGVVAAECYLEFFKKGFQFCKNEPKLKDVVNQRYNVTKAITGFGQMDNDPKKRQKINDWATQHLKERIDGNGWEQKRYIPDECALAFAKLIEEQIRVVK